MKWLFICDSLFDKALCSHCCDFISTSYNSFYNHLSLPAGILGVLFCYYSGYVFDHLFVSQTPVQRASASTLRCYQPIIDIKTKNVSARCYVGLVVGQIMNPADLFAGEKEG